MDDQVRALERPGIGWPIVSVEQEAQQRHRSTGRSGEATRQIGSKQLQGIDRPSGPELLEVREVVKQEGAAEARPIDQSGQADRGDNKKPRASNLEQRLQRVCAPSPKNFPARYHVAGVAKREGPTRGWGLR